MDNYFEEFFKRVRIEFSKDELEKLESLKVEYANRLYEDFDHIHAIFDFETSTHLPGPSKINALERIKQGIESGKIFDKSYFKVLKLENANVIFNDTEFLRFAVGYSILDHDCEQSAFMVLKEIWQVHLLNLMILENSGINIQVSTNYFKINMDFDSNIFPNATSHQFFIQTVNRSEFQISHKWISELYRFLKSKIKYNPDCHIKCTEFEFADYWNKYNLGYDIKKYHKSTGMAPQDTASNEYILIRSWYDKFN